MKIAIINMPLAMCFCHITFAFRVYLQPVIPLKFRLCSNSVAVTTCHTSSAKRQLPP